MKNRRSKQLGGPASLLMIAVLLTACTMVGHEKVAAWPRLEIVQHYVPNSEMRERCARYTGFGMSPEACAEFNFAANRCDIWFSADFPPPRQVVEHELLHCQGYDHIGESTMAELLAGYRSTTATPRSEVKSTSPVRTPG